MRNRLNFLGWMTPGNLGDEALLKANKIIFGRYNFDLFRIKPSSRNTEVEEKHSQITIISGGTCIPKITFWMKPTKYTYVFGAGIEDPLFYGPFDPILIDRLKNFDFRLIGVRGNISKALLNDWGIESEVIGDPCLSLVPDKVEAKDDMKVAINIGAAYSGGYWGDENRVLQELSKVCRTLKKEGYEPVLIPFWTNNIPSIAKLSKMEGVRIFSNWNNLEATFQLITKCKILIGEKLHSQALAAAANTPFVCLAYAPEHFDFSDSVGFSKYSIRTDRITAEKVLELFNDLVNNYGRMQNELGRKVSEYREKQEKFVARIFSDIESLPENKWDVRVNHGSKMLWQGDRFLRKNSDSIWKVWNRVFFLHVMRYFAG
jgi:hypothetical protein